MKPVSSPYRYSNNPLLDFCYISMTLVSSPYRYSNNGTLKVLPQLPQFQFQVLIGILTINFIIHTVYSHNFVSSPYRYSNNKTGVPSFSITGTVSSPYRYSNNSRSI